MYTHTHTHTHIYIYIYLHSRSGSHSKWEFLQDDSSFPNCSLVITLSHNRWRARLFASVFVSSYPSFKSIRLSISSACPSTHRIHLQIHLSLPYIYIYICIYVSLSIDRFIHLLCLNVVPRCTRSHTLA